MPEGLSQQDIQDLQDISSKLTPGDPRQGKINLLLNSQPTQFEQERDPSNRPGMLSTAANDLKGMFSANSDPRQRMGLGTKAGAVIGNEENQAKYDAEQKSRKDAGYSAPYRALAPVAEYGVGVNVPGIEHSADIGDTSGVVGHAGAAALPNVLPFVAKGVSKLAPGLAEHALGVTSRLKGRGRTIGPAILEETRGVNPETVRDSASHRIGELNNELESAAATSPNQSRTTPALNIIDDALAKAKIRNSGATIERLNAVKDQLTKEYGTGNVIPQISSPERVLNLKRGIGELTNSWGPGAVDRPLQSTLKRVYGALDGELDAAVPESKSLNQKMSSLIPAEKRAEITASKENFGQRVLGRFGARTGAMAPALMGAGLGSTHGPLGATIGGLTGLAATELIASPTAQMATARGLHMVGKAPLTSGAMVSGMSKNSQPQDEQEDEEKKKSAASFRQ
jgi:hypothetical protein